MENGRDDYDCYDTGPKYSARIAGRVKKSNRRESAYLISAAILTITNNYFTIAGIKAFVAAFSNPDILEAILPLGRRGWALVVLKTILFDLPFNFSNASYEVSEEIKNDITQSKKVPLISVLMKPFAKKWAILWITEVGTLVHMIWDIVGLLLCIPPQAFLSLYRNPWIFWPVAGVVIPSLLYLMIVNGIQTRYFEGIESEINLKKSRLDSDEELDLEDESKSWLYKLLKRCPWLETPILWGFRTQGPVHGFGDTMPIIVLLRHVLRGYTKSRQVGIIFLPASFVFIGSTIGTYKSEVKTSLNRYKKLCEKLPTKESSYNRLSLFSCPRKKVNQTLRPTTPLLTPLSCTVQHNGP